MARPAQRQERLSDTLRAFNAEIASLGDDDRAAVLDAIPKCFTPADPPARLLADGRKVLRRNLDMTPLIEAAPKDLKGGARDLARAVQRECTYRGEDWALEGAHLAVAEFITGAA